MNSNLKKYKDIHKGKRVFLIGNGPSLKDTELDLIKGEYSIAMNGISEIFGKTKWRPSYYVYTSTMIENKDWENVWSKFVDNVLKEDIIKAFIWRRFSRIINDKYNNIEWLNNVTDNKGNYLISEKWWPKNIEERIDKSATTMNVALQLANYMGFNEIILLGCDLMKESTDVKNDQNHFCKLYYKPFGNDKNKISKYNEKIKNVYILARKNIPQNIKIYNASLITKLDVLPKIDYKLYLKSNKI